MRRRFINEEQLYQAFAKALSTQDAKGWETGKHIADEVFKNCKEVEEPSFDLAQPQAYRQRETGKLIKVLPWFQPMSDEYSKFDLEGLLRDIEPTLFGQDVMGDMQVYTGLVMRVGYLIENENRMWFGVVMSEKELLEMSEPLGKWDEAEHGKDRTPLVTSEEKETP